MQRQTIQRRLVLEAVQQYCHHATADEVYAYLDKTAPGISRATVYRNLNNLATEGLIKKFSVPGAADRFDPTCSNHYHIQCEKCGYVDDIDMNYITDFTERIVNAHGFQVTGHDISFWGICPACQAPKE